MSDAKIERLKGMPLLRRCSDEQVAHLAELADEAQIESGRTITEQGHVGHHAYVIVSGTADVQVNGNSVATLDAGDIIGQISLFDQGPHTATVTSSSDMDLLVVDHQQFGDALANVPGLAVNMLKELAHTVRTLDSGLG
ncbi:MAG: cyclic nucleotide-binding domain-containing protein [Actinomycetia bacterium]|nr:cyclic nucleotide-binding domain-containing protein [Actinomycetes bacterium]